MLTVFCPKSHIFGGFICYQASSPYLLEVLDDGCVYSFLWETEAACPILTSKGTECTVEDKNSGYLFNLNSLKSDNHYEPRKKVADLPSTRVGHWRAYSIDRLKNLEFRFLENGMRTVLNSHETHRRIKPFGFNRRKMLDEISRDVLRNI